VELEDDAEMFCLVMFSIDMRLEQAGGGQQGGAHDQR